MTTLNFEEMAQTRSHEASQLTMDQIITATVRNALKVTGAKPHEKISIALATIPAPTPTDAINMLCEVLNELRLSGELEVNEVDTYKTQLSNLISSTEISSFEV